MAAFSKLVITDGTTYESGQRREVNLLCVGTGFCLTEWRPRTAEPKGGGVWSDSALAAGRRLHLSKPANVVETFTLEVHDYDADELVIQTRSLRQLLEKARAYWTTSWATEPVWIEAQGVNESEMRYSLVMDYRTPQDGDPYGQPFWQKVEHAGMSEFELVLEREPYWRDCAPGESECLEISAEQQYCASYPLLFPGGNTAADCVDLGSPAELTDLHSGDFTIDGYIRVSDPTRDNNVFSKGLVTVGLYINNVGRLAAYAAFVTTTAAATSSAGDIVADTWYHVAAVFDVTSKEFTLYIDGVDVTAVSVVGVGALVSDAGNSAFIGRLVGANTHDGEIGWLRISDNERWTAGFTPPDQCVLPDVDANTVWLGIREGTGTTVYDLTTNGNDGTIGGAVVWADCCAIYAGAEATCDADTVFITNHHKQAQLTHVYWYDASGPSYSPNLLTETLPYEILPAIPAAGDIFYAGIDTGIGNTGPFSSLVFDLATAGDDLSFSNSGGSYWQYWSGAAWDWLTTQDNTNADGAMTGEPFDTEGVRSVHWAQPGDWSVTTINGVAGYWVRCIVTGVGVAAAPPEQDNRNIYTISWPYIEVDADEVGGDIPALVRHYLHNVSAGGPYAPHLPGGRWIVGLRSLSRGAEFTAYLNCSDTQNIEGITGASVTVDFNEQDDTTAPTGRSCEYAPGSADDWGPEYVWTLGRTIAEQFYGRFRAFVRVNQTAGTEASIGARVYATMMYASGPDAQYCSQEAYTRNLNRQQVLDLGEFSLPPGRLLSIDDTVSVMIYLELTNGDAADVMTVYELILIPVDELAFEASGWFGSSAGPLPHLYYTHLLDIDGLSRPKISKRALRREVATDDIANAYMLMSADDIIVQRGVDQRLWFLVECQATLPLVISPPEVAHSLQSWRVQRYLSMRGNS